MPVMTLILDGENAFPDLKDKSFHHLGEGAPAIMVALLDRGMASGLPSICMRFELPDGQTVLAETSARLFCSTARMIMAKYPHLFDDIGAPEGSA